MCMCVRVTILPSYAWSKCDEALRAYTVTRVGWTATPHTRQNVYDTCYETALKRRAFFDACIALKCASSTCGDDALRPDIWSAGDPCVKNIAIGLLAFSKVPSKFEDDIFVDDKGVVGAGRFLALESGTPRGRTIDLQ